MYFQARWSLEKSRRSETWPGFFFFLLLTKWPQSWKNPSGGNFHQFIQKYPFWFKINFTFNSTYLYLLNGLFNKNVDIFVLDKYLTDQQDYDNFFSYLVEYNFCYMIHVLVMCTAPFKIGQISLQMVRMFMVVSVPSHVSSTVAV